MDDREARRHILTWWISAIITTLAAAMVWERLWLGTLRPL